MFLHIMIEMDNATAGSEESNSSTEGSAMVALDGNRSTLWHTDWNGCSDEEKWITIDMGKEYTFSKVKYVPRSSQMNGIITQYTLYSSNNGEQWDEITTGTWNRDNTEKEVIFSPITVRYFKLKATTQDSFASASEIYLRVADQQTLEQVEIVNLQKEDLVSSVSESSSTASTSTKEQ